MVRRTGLGGLLVAGGVVLGQSAAGAEEAPMGTSGPTETSTTSATEKGATETSSSATSAENTVTDKPTLLETTTESAAGPTKAAGTTRASSTPEAGGPRKVAAKPRAATSTKPVAPVRKASVKQAAPVKAAPARTVTVTVKAPPAKSTPKPVNLTATATTAAPPAEAAATLDAAPTGGSTPLDGSGGPAAGTISGLAILPPSSSSLAAGAQEIDSGQPVAGGSPPPVDTDETATASVNLALVSTTARSHPAVLTGTSPSGELTITIDQPLPGTVVPAGSPVLVTGTVGGTPVPVNFIYVIDISSGTANQGSCGTDTTILDCEIAGLIELNDANFDADVDVSLIAFDTEAYVADFDPAPGLQTTTPDSDGVNVDGIPDIVEALESLPSSLVTPDAAADFDNALAAIQAQLVEGEIHIVFLVSDGRSAGDTGPTTGPGSPLQALIDAGATIFTFAVNGTPGGCAAGQPLQVIAIGGGDCTEVAEPDDMRFTLVIEQIVPVDRVEIEVNGFVGIADLDGNRFSIVIPAGLLNLGRNDIIARAFGAADLEGEVAEANTFVVVTTPLISEPGGGPGGLDLDLDRVTVRVADLDEAKPPTALAGNLPVTGSGANRRAGTGALSFLLGGLLLGEARHLRRRRRPVTPA